MNLNERPLNIVVLGAGGIARKAYLPLLRTWPGCQIVGLYSQTQTTVDTICKDWQIEFGSTNLNNFLNLRPDAAFILTNTSSHNEIARQCLEANIDIYLEKPATVSSTQTRALADLAAKKERIFMVGFNRRYAPLYQLAKEYFSGHKIMQIVVEKHRTASHHVSLFNQYLDDTIHAIDLVRYYCGPVEPFHTTYSLQDGKVANAVSQMKLSNGGIALVLSCLMAGAWQERVSIYGDQLTVEVNAFRELRLKYPDHEEVYGGDRPGRWIPELTERGFSGELAHFFDCVRNRTQPITDGYQAAQTQELVEQLTRLAGADIEYFPD
jgi:virulence factor